MMAVMVFFGAISYTLLLSIESWLVYRDPYYWHIKISISLGSISSPIYPPGDGLTYPTEREVGKIIDSKCHFWRDMSISWRVNP